MKARPAATSASAFFSARASPAKTSGGKLCKLLLDRLQAPPHPDRRASARWGSASTLRRPAQRCTQDPAPCRGGVCPSVCPAAVISDARSGYQWVSRMRRGGASVAYLQAGFRPSPAVAPISPYARGSAPPARRKPPTARMGASLRMPRRSYKQYELNSVFRRCNSAACVGRRPFQRLGKP